MSSLRVVEVFDSLQGEGFWTGVPMTFIRLAGCNAPELGLGCLSWCDTSDSWDPAGGTEIEVADIVRGARLPRVCLTGGEPLLQTEGVADLLVVAHENGIKVHVETNGTIDPRPIVETARATARSDVRGDVQGQARPGAWAETRTCARSGTRSDVRSEACSGAGGNCVETTRGFDWVVVSPKPPSYLISPGWEGLMDELKLVSDDHLDGTTVERLAAQYPEAVVCIQPEFGGGPETAVGRASADRALTLVMNHPRWRLSLQTHKFLGIR